MKISPKQYALLLMEIAQSNLDADNKKDQLNNLAKIMVKNRDTKKITVVERLYFQEQKKEKGIVEILVRSAIALSDENKDKIKNIFCKKFHQESRKISIKNSIDKKIIGGLIIQEGNEIIDDSLKNKILKLSQSLG